jgi:predicted thioredoxin/glutaredoxin
MLTLKAIRHNPCRSGGVLLHAVLETGLKRKVDIIFVQEPPTDRRHQHPGFIFYWTEGRVMAAVRIDSIRTATQNTKLAEGMEMCRY